MKKLTDKDAILCVSVEEAIAIRDKFGLNIKEEHLKKALKAYADEICIYKDSLFSGYRTAQQGNCKITKASKILNKGVSKKELLRRIEKIEKVMIDNTEVTVSKTPEIEEIKNELTELPEKWCVKYDQSHLEIIIKLLNWKSEITTESGYLFSENKNSYFLSCQKHIGYNEITFEQFKKWVLKEDDSKAEIPKITEVQVDCSKLTKEQIQELADIVVDNGLIVNKEDITQQFLSTIFFRNSKYLSRFGIFAKTSKSKTITYQQFKDFYSKEKPDLGSTDTSLSIREVQVKVNSQEEANECAEIAKALGEVVWRGSSSLRILDNHIYFRFSGTDFYVNKFDENKKEISLQEFRERFGKPKEIDWSKAGQLVVSGEPLTKVLTLGYHKGRIFSGVQVEDNGLFTKGYYCTSWSKESFKLCTEPITLSN